MAFKGGGKGHMEALPLTQVHSLRKAPVHEPSRTGVISPAWSLTDFKSDAALLAFPRMGEAVGVRADYPRFVEGAQGHVRACRSLIRYAVADVESPPGVHA